MPSSSRTSLRSPPRLFAVSRRTPRVRGATARCEGWGPRVRIVVIGELDAASEPVLRAEVDQALERLDSGGVLTIDLGAVSFLDSWGTAPLDAALAGTARRGAALVLARPSARSLLVLRILGWDVVVTTTDDATLGAATVCASVRGSSVRARWERGAPSVRPLS